jgi:Zn-dependent peptidase ImmA (M78 family)
MIIPETIQIGGITWKVEYSKGVANEGNVYGSTHYRHDTIYLDPANSPERNQQTFLHELLHIAFNQAGLNSRKPFNEDKNEEMLIDALSNGLYGILKCNDLLK